MRKRSLIAVCAVGLGLLTACGGSSAPSRKASAKHPSASARGHYTLWVSEISRPGMCSGGACSSALSYSFASNLPMLTKAQAIQDANRLAHEASPIVRHVTCRRVPKGWHCQYRGLT